MKKETQKRKRLVFNKKSVRVLIHSDLSGVRGGLMQDCSVDDVCTTGDLSACGGCDTSNAC